MRLVGDEFIELNEGAGDIYPFFRAANSNTSTTGNVTREACSPRLYEKDRQGMLHNLFSFVVVARVGFHQTEPDRRVAKLNPAVGGRGMMAPSKA